MNTLQSIFQHHSHRVSLGSPSRPKARPVLLSVLSLSLAVFPPTLGSQTSPAAATQQVRESNLAMDDEELSETIREMEAISPTFRQMMETVRATTIPVMITRLERDALVPRVGAGQVVFTVKSTGVMEEAVRAVVYIDISSIRRMYTNHLPVFRATATERAVIEGEIKATIAHEIIHLFSVLQAEGNMAARCEDPAQGESHLDSCVVRMENEIRRELGIPETRIYGSSTREVQFVYSQYRELLRERQSMEREERQKRVSILLSEPLQTEQQSNLSLR